MKNMVYKKHLGKDRHKLEMAPLVDIVFQLLIFFLVATEMRPTEADFKTNLPGSGAGPMDKKDEQPIVARVYLSQKDQGNAVDVVLNKEYLGQMRAGKAEDILTGNAFRDLQERLTRARQAAGEKFMVVISGDKTVRTKFIAGALDAAVGAESPHITFGRPRED